MLFSLAQPPIWEDDAHCRGSDPAIFFGPNHFEPKREREAREAAAKTICQSCPTLQACREYALSEQETFGVWGGLGEADRRRILARQRSLAS